MNTPPVRLAPITITATRNPRSTFETPNSVLIFGGRELRDRHANTIADLFTLQPGLDVTGVGINQVRPVIRGQRGQRILLLEDGLRLNLTMVIAMGFGVIRSPINAAAVEPHRLSGAVLEWQWVRAFSPFINFYVAIFLIGGAALSASGTSKCCT